MNAGVSNVFVAVDGCATGPVCVTSDCDTIQADVRKSTNNRPHAILASQMPKCPVHSTQYGPSGKELHRSLPRRGAASTRSKGVIGNATSGNGELEGAFSDAGNRILDMFRQYIQAEKAPKKRPVQPSWVLDRNLDGKFESPKYASIFRPKLPGLSDIVRSVSTLKTRALLETVMSYSSTWPNSTLSSLFTRTALLRLARACAVIAIPGRF